MCVGFWSLEHPDYALILCSNRDEFLSRPTAPAHFHSFEEVGKDPGSDGFVLSGRDLKAGGTWLGINRAGRVALLTNITEEAKPYETSRGELVSSFLLSGSRGLGPLREHMSSLIAENAQYAGFNLLLLSPSDNGSASLSFEAGYVTNHGGGGCVTARPLTDAERRVGGLSNGVDGKGAEEWPKVKQGVEMFADVLGSIDDSTTQLELSERLFHLLTWKSDSPPRERTDLRNTIQIEPLSIRVSPTSGTNLHYGTRLSTVILIGRDGRVLFVERDIWMLDGENKVSRADAKNQRVFQFNLGP
ncbi:DUF833-domain-containing protein [Panus rudis PR-1116 ss-1]|nr:DUF833-domain-containing protein [Panus rudis PR-1116 ss-1]